MDVVVPAVIGISIAAGGIVVAPAVKYALDLSPYLYANTRTSARAGLIFDRKMYEELLTASNMHEIFALLEDSYYASITEHAKEFSSFSPLLDKDLFRTYEWLVNVVPADIKIIIKALKQKFEVNDIKSALNRLKNGEGIGELDYIDDHELKLKLEDVKDFASFTAVLGETKYSPVFTGKGLDSLAAINAALDKLFIEDVLAAVRKCKDKKAAEPFLEYWRTTIDLTNIRLAVRKVSGSAGNVDFIEGGWISRDELSGISDASQVESVLSGSIYAEDVSGTAGINIEHSFYNYIKKQAGAIAAKFTLKSGALVKFIILKELEVRNLNTLLKLKSENYSSEEIQKLMVM